MSKLHKKEILDYLRTQYVMSVTTSDSKGELWPATVYYLTDDDLNSYFMSDPHTLHCKNISKNPNVACTIANSDQKMSGPKIGIQISGTCTRVKGIKYAKTLVSAYKNSDLKVDSLSQDAFKKAATSGIYKVTPEKIKFFNTKLYPKEKYIEITL